MTSGRMEGASGAWGHLLIVACSKTKNGGIQRGPAIELYDGPPYRVLRKFLNTYGWPAGLQIRILSAKYGLIDATTMVEHYDLRLTGEAALQWRIQALTALRGVRAPRSVFVNLGRDYLPAVAGLERIHPRSCIQYAEGGIGLRMHAMKEWLEGLPRGTASIGGRPAEKRSYLYFFPDWDDYVYEPFVADETDELRKSGKLTRTYAHEIFGDQTPYDGVLLSLAQVQAGKGALSRVATEGSADLRAELRLPERMLLFGDCGAFSYASQESPPFTPAEAAAKYEACGFDVGASVDHIPLLHVTRTNGRGERRKHRLTAAERRRRIALTEENAREFLRVAREMKCSFVPLGVIQGISVASYVECLHNYIDMGYQHIALGGLVPRTDAEILEILCEVRRAVQDRTGGRDQNTWLHLFGVLRPKLQRSFWDLGVSSFDSASYFRKAWLRSDQNYLAIDGNWYASIRVPFSTSKRLCEAVADVQRPEDLANLESRCLTTLRDFARRRTGREHVLGALDSYGPLLTRKSETNHFSSKYRALLKDRPWEDCPCPICKDAGIEVVVFRGANRNKRRGFHNTWVFYKSLGDLIR